MGKQEFLTGTNQFLEKNFLVKIGGSNQCCTVNTNYDLRIMTYELRLTNFSLTLYDLRNL